MDGESVRSSSPQEDKSNKKVSIWSKIRAGWRKFTTCGHPKLKKFQYDSNNNTPNFDDTPERDNDPTVENLNPNENETGVSKETKESCD